MNEPRFRWRMLAPIATSAVAVAAALLAGAIILWLRDKDPWLVYRLTVERGAFVMLLGLNAEVFNGLAGMVDPAERLGTVRHLLVRPDAYDAALGAALTPRLIALVGPALGMECVHGTGMHVNPDEWTLDEDSGGLVISSTARRAADLDRAPLVLSGRVVDSACPCGLPGPRIELRPAL